jgi:hypothetical protein
MVERIVRIQRDVVAGAGNTQRAREQADPLVAHPRHVSGAGRARLYPKLLDGYLLDGLERLDRKPTGEQSVAAFFSAAGLASQRRSPSAGLGDDVRLAREGVVGSGLLLDGELLQLSVFTSDVSGRRTRVARPSRRR